MVKGSNLGKPKLNFIFAKLSFWLEYGRVEETLVEWTATGGWKAAHK